MERSEALAAWAAHTMAEHFPGVAAQMLCKYGYACPPKVARSQARVAQLVAKIVLRRTHHHEAILQWTRSGWRKVGTHVDKGAAAVADVLTEHPEMGPLFEFAAATQPEVFADALAAMPEAGRVAVEECTARALSEIDRMEREIMARQQVGEEVQKRSREKAAQARAQQARVQAEAMRQRTRAMKATTTAAMRIALAEKRLTILQDQCDSLRILLAERDEQIHRLAARFEQRLSLATRPQEEGQEASVLAGQRVLVLGDPNRAVAYRAEALAMGAAAVAFLNARATPGERLASATQAADVVVLIAAWAKHSTDGCVCRNLRQDAVMLRVRQAGVQAFRHTVATAMQARRSVV